MHEPERKRRRGSRDPSTSAPAVEPSHAQGAVGNQALQRLLQRGARLESSTSANEKEAGEVAAHASSQEAADAPTTLSQSPAASDVRNEFGAGQPLDREVRSQLAPVVGANLDPVRVHTGPNAEESARALDARAWTFGNDVFLGPNAPSVRSSAGRALLAHELTHSVQQSESAEPRIARQPNTPGAIADPQTALRARLQQVRARLALLEAQQSKSQDAFVDSTADARQKESLARDEPKLKSQIRSAGAAKDLWGGSRATERIKSAVTVAQSGNSVNLTARLQISYLALDEKKGRAQSEIDIPRIAQAIRDAWQVTIPDGEYAGVTFQLTPQITYLPRDAKPADDQFHIQVRGPDKEPSTGDSVHGTISVAPVHLEGSRVIVVAHELAHVFGFMDAYFSMQTQTKKGPGIETWNVGRGDAANRPDLLGLIDPVQLKTFADKGAITKQDYARQTSSAPHIWAEDAATVLRSLGIAPPTKPRPSIDSEDFDPQVELTEEARPKQQKLAGIRGQRARVDDSMAWLDRAEEIMRLQKEERDLTVQLGANP